jgi:hypothetical protein
MFDGLQVTVHADLIPRPRFSTQAGEKAGPGVMQNNPIFIKGLVVFRL